MSASAACYNYSTTVTLAVEVHIGSWYATTVMLYSSDPFG
jgi:hypothetical protein